MREAGESLIYIKPKHAWKRLKAADEENVTAYVYGISGSGCRDRNDDRKYPRLSLLPLVFYEKEQMSFHRAEGFQMRRWYFDRSMRDRISDSDLFRAHECFHDHFKPDSGGIRQCAGGGDRDRL